MRKGPQALPGSNRHFLIHQGLDACHVLRLYPFYEELFQVSLDFQAEGEKAVKAHERGAAHRIFRCNLDIVQDRHRVDRLRLRPDFSAPRIALLEYPVHELVH